MAALVRDLKDFLQDQQGGAVKIQEEHADRLEGCARDFLAAPAARLRKVALLGSWGLAAAAVVLCLLAGRPLAALGLTWLAGATGLAYVLASGYREKSYLFLKLREYVLGSRWGDWLTAGAGLGLAVVLLAVCQLFWPVLLLTALAGVLAVGLYLGLDRTVRGQREEPLARAEDLLKRLRLRGVEEEELRKFVCEYAGTHWEEFYEALFGYEAKLEARARWGTDRQNRPRPKAAAWREPVLAWVEARQQARRAAREKQHLQAVEQKELQAQGLGVAQAREKAEELAEAMVTQAAQLKQSLRRLDREGATVPRAAFQLDFAPGAAPRGRGTAARLGKVLALPFAPQVRFLVGAVLLAGCLGWMNQNGLIPGRELKRLAREAVSVQNPNLPSVDLAALQVDLHKETTPLRVPLVPEVLTSGFNSFNPGVAGLLLVLSAFAPGALAGLFAFAAAAVAWAGPRLGIPSLGPLKAEYLSMLAGAGLFVLGLMLGRGRR
jgi:hypothetical protein